MIIKIKFQTIDNETEISYSISILKFHKNTLVGDE